MVFKNEFGDKILNKISFEIKRSIMEKSKIPKELRRYKWQGYVPWEIGGKRIKDINVIRSREEAKKKCKKYTIDLIEKYNNIKENKKINDFIFKSIIIYGPESSGKTVLATLIARTLAEKCEKTILFVDFMDLNSEMYTVLDFRTENFTSIINRYLEPNILIIDEIAKNKIAPMMEPLLSTLIRQRKNNSETNITIITSKVDKSYLRKIIGDDCSRLINKKRNFEEINICAENKELESDGDEVYDVDKIIKKLNLMFKKPRGSGAISQGQLRRILDNSIKYDKKGKNKWL